MHKYNTLYGFVLKCLNKVQVGNDQENAHRIKSHSKPRGREKTELTIRY